MSDQTTFQSDPILRRSMILDDLGIDKSTLSDWIARGDFPAPLVLNPGQAREITGWRTSTYVAWKENLPQRAAKPISQAAYSDEAIAKGRRTRAERQAAKQGSAPEPAPQSAIPPARVRRPRS